MQRQMLKSKIHRATVTARDPDYVGSITLDPPLLEARSDSLLDAKLASEAGFLPLDEPSPAEVAR